MSTNDVRLLINEVEAMVRTIQPDIDESKLSIRLEEIANNYAVQRKTVKEAAQDLDEKIDLFISAMRIEGLSEKTLAGYRIELNVFKRFINKGTTQIKTSDIRLFLGSNSKLKIGTISKKISVLKSFFGWLVKEELLLRNPMAKINLPKDSRRRPKGLSIEELEIVRESCQTLRQRALIEVMYSTGCRLSEVANMKKTDVNMQNMSASVVGKGDKERTVHLSFKALYHLRKYLKSRTDECEYLFVTIRRPIRQMNNDTIALEIKKIEDQANITKKLTPHVLRHTFAQLSMDNGVELADLQHLMGHSDPGTTLIYASVSEERKKQAFRRYHVQ